MRRGVLTVLAGAVLLGGAWLALPPTAPPLYDGIGAPDEPYRYLDPPPGAATHRHPDPAAGMLPVRGGSVGAGSISTDESGPQASVFVEASGLRVPAGAGAVTVRLVPVPPLTVPADGRIEGNVYDITVTADKPGPVTVNAGVVNAVDLLLRIPTATTAEIRLEVLVGLEWRQIQTYQTGNDIYSGLLPVFGEVAAVRVLTPDLSTPLPGSVAGTASRSAGFSVGPLAAGGVVLALVVLIVAVRISRMRHRTADRGHTSA